MRKSSCHIVFFLFLLMTPMYSHSGQLSQEEGMRLLSSLIEKSMQSDYIAELLNPPMKEIANVGKVVFYRKHEGDSEPCLRADFYIQRVIAWTLIQRDGRQYAIHHATGTVVRGGFFQRIFYLESLNNRLHSRELDYCTFTTFNAKLNGRQCEKLIVRFIPESKPESKASISWIIGYLPADEDEIKENHPYVREYWYDAETYTILRLVKYNFYGRLLSDIASGHIELNPDWSEHPDIFVPPPEFDTEVGNMNQFQKLITARHGKNALTAVLSKNASAELTTKVIEGNRAELEEPAFENIDASHREEVSANTDRVWHRTMRLLLAIGLVVGISLIFLYKSKEHKQ